jgi:hypothetical protein
MTLVYIGLVMGEFSLFMERDLQTGSITDIHTRITIDDIRPRPSHFRRSVDIEFAYVRPHAHTFLNRLKERVGADNVHLFTASSDSHALYWVDALGLRPYFNQVLTRESGCIDIRWEEQPAGSHFFRPIAYKNMARARQRLGLAATDALTLFDDLPQQVSDVSDRDSIVAIQPFIPTYRILDTRTFRVEEDAPEPGEFLPDESVLMDALEM